VQRYLIRVISEIRGYSIALQTADLYKVPLSIIHNISKSKDIDVTNYVYLGIAIVAETIATTTLKSTEGLTRLWPTLVVAVGYAIAFYLLSIIVQTLPVGIVYAIWSGAGIVLVTVVAFVWQKQVLDFAALVGIGLILAGVVIVNLFSKTVTH
jgi:small multidrug resistance pump